MGCVDSLVSTGKKYLPPPVVLFISHLVFATWTALWMCLTVILGDGGYCGNNWMSYMNWVGVVVLCVLIAVAKYKETSDIVGTLVALFAFILTLIGIQVVPFYCFSVSEGSYIVLSIARLVIDIPLVIIYGTWCKSELDSILPTTG